MSATKRRRNVLTIEAKLEIINQLEMTICGNDAFYCKIVFCLIIQKNQLSEPLLVPITSNNWRSNVYPACLQS